MQRVAVSFLVDEVGISTPGSNTASARTIVSRRSRSSIRSGISTGRLLHGTGGMQR
jgi:hypothetical protein